MQRLTDPHTEATERFMEKAGLITFQTPAVGRIQHGVEFEIEPVHRDKDVRKHVHVIRDDSGSYADRTETRIPFQQGGVQGE